MTFSLNPDAQIYTPCLSSSQQYYSPSLFQSPNPNPNTFYSPFHYPFYFEYSRCISTSTPPYLYYFHSTYVPPPLASSLPKCFIEEIETEKCETEEVEETKAPSKALARSFRRSVASKANKIVKFVRHCHSQKKRASVVVSHEDFMFKGDMSGPDQGWTTIMIKNLPNKFNKGEMVSILDKHCQEENRKVEGETIVLSEYDFFYLPIDFKTKANYGYCFVNFTTADAAVKLHKYLHGHSWEYLGSSKICEVNYARIQGLPGLLGHSRNSSYACNSDEFLPVKFEPPRNGDNISPGLLVGKRIIS